MTAPSIAATSPAQDLVTAEAVRLALRRWHQPELGRTELAETLVVVREVVRQADTPDSPILRGSALRRVLGDGIEALRQAGYGDAADLLRRQYVKREPFMLIASDLALGERQFFKRQARAIEALAAALSGLETQARQSSRAAAEAGATVSATVQGTGRAGLPGRRTDEVGKPDLASTAAPRHNLPAPLTSFIGREREQAELRAQLHRSRLVTLTGLGGAGKTRLALEVAFAVVDDYPDGAWWLELAPLTSRAQVTQAVAGALGVRESPNRTFEEALSEYFSTRRLLLVLDNCEHLVADCAALAHRWLRAAPELHILATSREALELVGELVWPVPRLAVPTPDQAALQALGQVDAVRLFVERAALVRHGFALTSENAAAVASLCRRLEGIPLAIELAAARARLLSPEQMLSRLEDRFALLSGGSRVAGARQQTMHGAVDWSYDLLDEPERTLFARLAVFRGGWTLEAAEAVGAGGAIAAADVMDLLGQLVNKSLVQAEDVGGGARYGFLETIRAYAAERLAASGEQDATSDTHLAYFVALGQVAERTMAGPAEPTWARLLDSEQDNWQAALRWAESAGAADAGLGLAISLRPLWESGGHVDEGRHWLTTFAAMDGGSSVLKAKALNTAGCLSQRLDDFASAETAFQESRALYDGAGDQRGVGLVLGNLGINAARRGSLVKAKTFFKESLVILRAFDDKLGTANAIHNIGSVAINLKDWDEAHRYFAEALPLFRETGNARGIAMALDSLGDLANIEGDFSAAETWLDEALALRQEIGDELGMAVTIGRLAVMARHQHQWDRAERLLVDSLALLSRISEHHTLPEGLVELATVRIARMREAVATNASEIPKGTNADVADKPDPAALARSARLLAAGDTQLRSLGYVSPETENVAAGAAFLREAMDPKAFAAAWREGEAMSREQAVAYAVTGAEEMAG